MPGRLKPHVHNCVPAFCFGSRSSASHMKPSTMMVRVIALASALTLAEAAPSTTRNLAAAAAASPSTPPGVLQINYAEGVYMIESGSCQWYDGRNGRAHHLDQLVQRRRQGARPARQDLRVRLQ